MDYLASVIALQREGKYRAALTMLDSRRQPFAVEAEIIRAELHEVTGAHAKANELIDRARRSSRLTPSQRARCENVLGRILIEDGLTDQGTERLQKAAALATKAGDLRLLCGVQCKLLAVVSERSGPGAALPLLSELRQNTTRLGETEITAQLHVLVAEMEATRGAVASSLQHLEIGQHLLATHP